jgi:hypothetical protein
MSMTIDAITTLEPLKTSASKHRLDDLAVFVPEEDDVLYEENSYIFFADTHRAEWRDVLSFKKFAERLLGGPVYVLNHGHGDGPETGSDPAGAFLALRQPLRLQVVFLAHVLIVL